MILIMGIRWWFSYKFQAALLGPVVDRMKIKRGWKRGKR